MTDELRLPCRESGRPDDWYIGRDGKQYTDDEFVTEDQVVAYLDDVDPDGTRSVEALDATARKLEAEAKKAALVRRRKAREACHTSCLFRTRCLGEALDRGEEYGTWGGYYEEEIRELRREIARRRRGELTLLEN